MTTSGEEGDGGRTAAAEMVLARDSVINGLYRLVRILGTGGMGEVWEAQHERTRGRVAIKLLLPELGRHAEVLTRFQREAEITSGLNHPNIIRVTDFDKLPNGRPFLAMEFLVGQELSSLTKLGRPMPPIEVAEIIEQIAMGLQAAHDQSVIHRDLKPANIFLVPLAGSSRVMVKILDFGISKALDGLSRLTQTQSVIGTPQYMAPEQATGGSASLDARADQFSLAAIAYELLTGRMAFAGDGTMNVLFKVVQEMPPSFAELAVSAPPDLEAAVVRGLAKSPAQRFPTVLAFATELKRAAGLVSSVVHVPLALLPGDRTTLVFPTPPSTTLGTATGEVRSIEELGSPERAREPEQALITAGSSTGTRKTAMTGIAVAVVGCFAALVVVISIRGRHETSGGATPPTSEAPAAFKPVNGPPAHASDQKPPEPPPPPPTSRLPVETIRIVMPKSESPPTNPSASATPREGNATSPVGVDTPGNDTADSNRGDQTALRTARIPSVKKVEHRIRPPVPKSPNFPPPIIKL